MIKNYSISVLFGKRVTQQWMYAFALLLTTMLFSTNGNAQTPCLNPINPMLLSVNNSSATIGWTHPSPAPWSGYDIWHTSIPAYTPTSSFSPSGSTNTNTYTLSGYEPGATIYVRVWEYSNDNPGTFGICATSPIACTTPTAQPTALVLNVSGGSINGSFTAASPAPSPRPRRRRLRRSSRR